MQLNHLIPKQYSLRLLLVMMSLIAMAAAFGRMCIVMTEAQQTTAEELRRTGFHVVRAYEPRAWYRRFAARLSASCHIDDEVVAFSLYASQTAGMYGRLTEMAPPDEAVVNAVVSCRYLRTLDLRGMVVSEPMLAKVIELKDLEHLYIGSAENDSPETIEALAELRRLKHLWSAPQNLIQVV